MLCDNRSKEENEGLTEDNDKNISLDGSESDDGAETQEGSVNHWISSMSKSGNFKTRCAAAIRDWGSIMVGNSLFRTPKLRQKIKDETLEDAVLFILDDVQVISGERRI